jgi:hypothetical protein
MTPDELMTKIKDKTIELNQKEIDSVKFGRDKASTERFYRVELSKELMKLRVVEHLPIALIGNIAKGDERISQLRLNRDLAESNYFISIEAIRNIRLEIETLRSFLAFERKEIHGS